MSIWLLWKRSTTFGSILCKCHSKSSQCANEPACRSLNGIQPSSIFIIYSCVFPFFLTCQNVVFIDRKLKNVINKWTFRHFSSAYNRLKMCLGLAFRKELGVNYLFCLTSTESINVFPSCFCPSCKVQLARSSEQNEPEMLSQGFRVCR